MDDSILQCKPSGIYNHAASYNPYISIEIIKLGSRFTVFIKLGSRFTLHHVQRKE